MRKFLICILLFSFSASAQQIPQINKGNKIKVTSSSKNENAVKTVHGTSYLLVARLLDKNKEVLWESNGYKSSPNGTNGFNAGKAVAKKLLRDLKKLAGD